MRADGGGAHRASGAEPGVHALHLALPQAAVGRLPDVGRQRRDLVKQRVLRQVAARTLLHTLLLLLLRRRLPLLYTLPLLLLRRLLPLLPLPLQHTLLLLLLPLLLLLLLLPLLHTLSLLLLLPLLLLLLLRLLLLLLLQVQRGIPCCRRRRCGCRRGLALPLCTLQPRCSPCRGAAGPALLLCLLRSRCARWAQHVGLHKALQRHQLLAPAVGQVVLSHLQAGGQGPPIKQRIEWNP